jgi:hypothetical protein
MAGRPKTFPEAALDPIICGNFMLFRLEDGIKPVVAASFFVGDSAPSTFKGLPDGTPLLDVQFGFGHPKQNGRWDYEAEAEMLLALHWVKVNIFDCEYRVGYNSRNFDETYAAECLFACLTVTQV